MRFRFFAHSRCCIFFQNIARVFSPKQRRFATVGVVGCASFLAGKYLYQNHSLVNKPKTKFATLEDLSAFLSSLPRTAETERLHAIQRSLQPILDMEGIDSAKEQLLHQILSSIIKRDCTQYRNVIVTGAPGSGKTTFAQHLASLYIAMGLVTGSKCSIMSSRVTESMYSFLKHDADRGVVIIDTCKDLFGHTTSYTPKAMDDVMHFMVQNSNRLFIFAGDATEIQKFEKCDARFNDMIDVRFEIPQCEPRQLARIFCKLCASCCSLATYKIDFEETHLQQFFEKNQMHFKQNGRDVLEFVKHCIDQNERPYSRDHRYKISLNDLEGAMYHYAMSKGLHWPKRVWYC
jgi:adenylate kinase family enzyme